MFRSLGRALLGLWGATGVAPGWRYYVVERWGARLAPAQRLDCVVAGGLRMECDLRDFVERFVYFMGLAEPIEAWVFLRLLSPGMTVIDVGANIGQYTLLAGRAVGPGGRVLAFEPMPANFARIERHVALNGLGNVTAYRVALWDQKTQLKFAQPPEYADNAGTFGPGIAGAAHYEDVDAIAFDDLALPEGLHRIGAIKIDAEGSELHALRGMRRTIERDRPVLLIELSRPATLRAGETLESLWQYLTVTLGYKAWKIGSTPEWSGPLTDITQVEHLNAVCYFGEPPTVLKDGWSYDDVLQWARSG